MQAKRTGFDQRWLRTHCVLRSSGSAHVTQIASQICVAHCSLTVSQIVQLAALGIAEVIVRRASPAGLMQMQRRASLGAALTLARRIAIARRASWLKPARLGSGSLCSPASDAGEAERCNSFNIFGFCLRGANANHLPAISFC